MTTRRGFLGAMLAAAAAPAIVRAGSLMRINPAIVVPRVDVFGEFGYIDGFRFIESVVIVHPSWADALRAEGVPVRPDPRRIAMR